MIKSQEQIKPIEVTEFTDLYAVIKMCIDEGILISEDVISVEQVEEKQKKVEKYLKYSKSVGR